MSQAGEDQQRSAGDSGRRQRMAEGANEPHSLQGEGLRSGTFRAALLSVCGREGMWAAQKE